MAEEKVAKINNTQRREFAKIVDRVIADKLSAALQEVNDAKVEGKNRAAEESGAVELDIQIDALDKEVKLLQKKKEELGFGHYDNIIAGSKAEHFIKEFVRIPSMEVSKLKGIRDSVQQRIWASQTIDEASSILEKVKKM